MTERIEQQICIKFRIKHEYSPVETIRMIQKAAAMGNWWLAASSQQCAGSYTRSCAEFFGKASNHPSDLAPLKWDLVPCDFWLFLKLKSLFKREEISDQLMRFRKIWRGSWWWLEELCEVPTFIFGSVLRHHFPMYNVSCIFFNKCLYFSHYMSWYLLDRPCITHSMVHRRWDEMFNQAGREKMINFSILSLCFI